jgi:hypothetical protein
VLESKQLWFREAIDWASLGTGARFEVNFMQNGPRRRGTWNSGWKHNVILKFGKKLGDGQII